MTARFEMANGTVQGKARNAGRWHGRGDDWSTDLVLFAALDAAFHFTLDPCADRENAKAPLFFTTADDGLTKDWGRHRVFMNPPYGRAAVRAWVEKAWRSAQSGATVVCLLPSATDLAWWHDYVLPYAEVRFVRGRPPFHLPNGGWNYPWTASVVVVFYPPETVFTGTYEYVTYTVTTRGGVATVARLAGRPSAVEA